MKASEALQAMVRQGVIPVLRLTEQGLAREAIGTLRGAGYRVFELTLSIPGATELIAEHSSQEELVVGAGTVLTLEDAVHCLDAGARFLVSPCFLPGLPELCSERGAACIVGALTPSEVRQASLAGSHAVKVFPVSSVGGPSHVRALLSVFPDLILIPTGGIGLGDVVEYLAAGAACVGVGSDLFDVAELAGGDAEGVASQAAAYLDVVSGYRAGQGRPEGG